MNAVFADINKLRDNKNVVAKKAKTRRKAPAIANTANKSVTSINNHLSSTQNPSQPQRASDRIGVEPIALLHSGYQELQTPTSPLSPASDDGAQRKRRKKKKKKKKREQTPTTINISDDGLNPNDYQMIAQREEKTRNRHKTEISVLADRAYPDASSLLDLQDKPPLLLFTYIFAFIASIDMMVNIPTLYAACHETESANPYYYVFILLGYVSVQFVSTWIVGAWLDRRPITEILTFLNLCIIIGNVTYTFGVHNKQGFTMLIGRGICGCGSSILIIGYAHVTRYSKLASRESRILYFRFVIALGTIIGPLIGTIVGGGSANWSFLNIDPNNSGSFIVACIGVLYLLSLVVFCFLQQRHADHQEQQRALWGRTESESNEIDEHYSNLNHHLTNYVWRPHRFCSKEAVMLWFLYTSAVFTFWSFCGAIIPVGALQGSNVLSTTAVYAVFVYVGITYLAAFGLNKFAFSYFKIQRERRVIVSLILMVIGSIFLTSFGIHGDGKSIYTWQIVVATPFLTSGFCISTMTIPALYVTLVGASVAGLGLRMSWFFSLASFGLLSGPIYGYLVLEQYGSVNLISHTSSLILLVALLVGLFMIKTAHTDIDFTKRVRASHDFDAEDADKSGNDLNQGLLIMTDRL